MYRQVQLGGFQNISSSCIIDCQHTLLQSGLLAEFLESKATYSGDLNLHFWKHCFFHTISGFQGLSIKCSSFSNKCQTEVRTGEGLQWFYQALWMNALHTQKSSLKYLLFSVAQSMSVAHHFFSWGAAKWEILLHMCFVCLYKVQPVSRLFSSSCFSLKSISLSVAHVVVAVKVNGCKKARSGGRDNIFHLEKK